jgi:protein SCO1/2
VNGGVSAGRMPLALPPLDAICIMSAWISRHPIASTFVPLALFIVSAGLLIAVQRARHAASNANDGLDDFGSVGSFAFVDKDGRPVTDRDLAGKVWIVACFFTCCTESCPHLSAAMARLQSELAHVPDLRLVSLTVDPTHDTPQKLDQYATTYQAAAERWIFLTGGEEAVRSFVQERLHLGAAPNTDPDATPGNRVLHSDKLTLIDRRGVIRGYFDGRDPERVAALKAAAERLAREPAP